MTTLSLALMLGLWSAPAGDAYYALPREGAIIGWAHVTPSARETWEGREADVLRGELHIDISMLGQRVLIESTSTSAADPADGSLLGYDWSMKRGDLERTLSVRFAEGKATITRRSGTGEPAVTTIDAGPDTYAWGENDFSALALAAGRLPLAPGEAREITVITPDSEGKVPVHALAAAKRTVMGVERDVRLLSLAGGVVLAVDPTDGSLLGIELPNGDPVAVLADASVIDAAGADAGADALASHFVRSSVAFGDPAKVTRLVARVSFQGHVVGDGVVKPESPMQTFEGTIDRGTMTGTLTITTIPYGGEGAEAFPIASDPPEDLAPLLEPSSLIESDDPAIVAKAKELTEGATDAWQAAKRIGEWVAQNISYRIADSPSAKLCLDTGHGDCGPHATLSIALLRAAGIPARLVGGLTYAPQYGGSFGQHAWVEAWVGGHWVCFDPTTGEIDQLSAVHVKVFEGLGAVQPKSLEILEYEGGDVAAEGGLRARPMPWATDRDWTWTYADDGKAVGSETMRVAKAEPEGWTITSTVKLGEGDGQYLAHHLVTLDESLEPREWRCESTVQGATSTVTLTFAEGRATRREETPGEQPHESTVEMPAGGLVVANNAMVSLVVDLLRMEFAPGAVATWDFLQIETLMTLELAFERAAEPATWGGTPCHEVAFPLAGAKLYVTEDGRFLGQAGPGTLEIRLAE